MFPLTNRKSAMSARSLSVAIPMIRPSDVAAISLRFMSMAVVFCAVLAGDSVSFVARGQALASNAVSAREKKKITEDAHRGSRTNSTISQLQELHPSNKALSRLKLPSRLRERLVERF